MSRRWAAPVMRLMRHGQQVQNPRVLSESWLAVNFVPRELHAELDRRLDDIQFQAVHMAALQLREAGHPAAADLIDPGAE